MSDWLKVLLEIVKITIPALVVFFTVYHLMKQFHENQYKMRMLEFRQKQQKTTIPLRLQAFERLSLFCERISIPNLLLRLSTQEMTSARLQVSMMLAIQHEFEHNITQQVYVSESLWKIIRISKDNVVAIINEVSEGVDPRSDAENLKKALFAYLEKEGENSLPTALSAIKKEAALLM